MWLEFNLYVNLKFKTHKTLNRNLFSLSLPKRLYMICMEKCFMLDSSGAKNRQNSGSIFGV